MSLERPETSFCCGEDHRCGSATGDTHFCTTTERVCVHVCTWPNSKHPICKIQLLMGENRIRLFVWTWCLQRHWLPVCLILVVMCASPERVCMQPWGLHVSLMGSWTRGQGTAAAWCYQTRMGGIPSDLDSHQSVLSKHFLHLTSITLVLLL